MSELPELRWPLPRGHFHAKLVAIENANTLLFEALEGDVKGRQARYQASRSSLTGCKHAKIFEELRGFALATDEVPDWESLLKSNVELVASIWVKTHAGEIARIERACYANTNKKNCDKTVTY